MRITVTQWMQATMTKTVEIPDDVDKEDAKDYAYDNGEWEIQKVHNTETAQYEVEE